MTDNLPMHSFNFNTYLKILIFCALALTFLNTNVHAKSYNMHEAVNFSLKNNPLISASQLGSRAAEQEVKSQRGKFGPSLSTAYGFSQIKDNIEPKTLDNRPELGVYTWNIGISQPLFTGFNLLNSYQKSTIEVDRQKSNELLVKLTIIEEVQTNFLAYLRAIENVRSENDALNRLKDQLAITKAYYSVGLRPKLDVLQAEVDVSQAESILIQVQNQRDTVKAKLNTLLGYSAIQDHEYTGYLHHVPFPFDLQTCIAKAYAQRPDFKMAILSVAIAKKDKKIIQSDYYPQIQAFYKVTNYGNSPDLQDRGNYGEKGTTWELGAQAVWNVFNWGTTHYADQKASSIIAKINFELKELKLQIGYDVKSKFLALYDSEKRINVAKKGIAQALEAYNTALARYHSQIGTNFDVLNASANLTLTEAALTSAQADYLTSLSRLFVAMGHINVDIMSEYSGTK